MIDGWSVDNPDNPVIVKFGILQEDLKKRNERGQISALAQFDGIVVNGLISARHIFCGLNRPLCADDSMKADTQKFVHSWKPRYDYDWPDPLKRPRKLPPPTNCAFVVIVTKNERHTENWPEVYGWIDRWNWVDEDSSLPEAPLNWFTRYIRKLLTRKGV